jgi:hypothetical protein
MEGIALFALACQARIMRAVASGEFSLRVPAELSRDKTALSLAAGKS